MQWRSSLQYFACMHRHVFLFRLTRLFVLTITRNTALSPCPQTKLIMIVQCSRMVLQDFTFLLQTKECLLTVIFVTSSLRKSLSLQMSPPPCRREGGVDL
jgi:hypothetical protein